VKRLTSTQRWFGPLLISVLLILALLQLAACDKANNGYSNGSNNSTGSGSLGTNSGGGFGSNNGTWDVTINSKTSPTSYNGYTPYAGHHFLIVDASFTNTSSGAQILGPGLFVVKDNEGQQYSEDQASNPGQTFTVEPNQTIETQTAYVVPDSECNFTLTFVGNSNSDGLHWSIPC
jgi:Domain of unknown function (DUF4352)